MTRRRTAAGPKINSKVREYPRLPSPTEEIEKTTPTKSSLYSLWRARPHASLFASHLLFLTIASKRISLCARSSSPKCLTQRSSSTLSISSWKPVRSWLLNSSSIFSCSICAEFMPTVSTAEKSTTMNECSLPSAGLNTSVQLRKWAGTTSITRLTTLAPRLLLRSTTK